MADFTIYLGNKNYSSWSLRPWLVLKQTGVAFEEIVIPLYEPTSKATIMKYSPSGTVPALRHGDLVVWDSLAICEYLAESFPTFQLWPRDPDARAVARSVCAELHSGFQALRAHLPMNVRSSFPNRGVTPEVQTEINRVMAIWRDCRKRFGEGNGDFLEKNPLVSAYNNYGNYVEVRLAPGADAQQLLQMVAARSRVNKFELMEPSLEEIFINTVGKTNA